jgi:hypothetical protein
LKSLMLAVMLLFAALGNVGCAVFGKEMDHQPFDPGRIGEVTPGKSTAAEVSGLFGAPSEVVKMSNGNAYIYERSVAKGTALWLVLVSFVKYDRQYDRLVFLFNKEDVLTHYGISLNAGKASYGLPF